jgi:hypothetical protein
LKGLRERRRAETSKIEGQLLGARVYPGRIRTTLSPRLRSRFFDHVLVRIDADDLAVQGREEEGDLAGSAADVEQSSAAVEAQLLLERGRELRGVRQTAVPVVPGAAAEQRPVPLPVSDRHRLATAMRSLNTP